MPMGQTCKSGVTARALGALFLMRQMCAEPAAVHRTFACCVLRAAFPSGPNPCPIYAAGGRARRPHRRRDGSAAQPPCRAHTPRLSQCGACAVSGAHAVQAVGTCGESTAPKEGCTCSGLADLPPAGGRAWLASRARTVAWSRRPGKLCTQQAQSVAHAQATACACTDALTHALTRTRAFTRRADARGRTHCSSRTRSSSSRRCPPRAPWAAAGRTNRRSGSASAASLPRRRKGCSSARPRRSKRRRSNATRTRSATSSSRTCAATPGGRSASFGVGVGVSRGWASVARACRLGFDEAEHDG